MLPKFTDKQIMITLLTLTLAFIVTIFSLIVCLFLFNNPLIKIAIDITLLTGNFLATIACGGTIIILFKRQVKLDTYLLRTLMLGMIIFFIFNLAQFLYHGIQIIIL